MYNIYIYSDPILHIQRSLSSKFQLQQLQKDASGPKTEKMNITIEFFMSKLV